MTVQPRKSTNLSLDAQLLAQARELDINLSRAAENGVRNAVARATAERWRAENASALDASNLWCSENGLPLDQYRRF